MNMIGNERSVVEELNEFFFNLHSIIMKLNFKGRPLTI